MYKKLYIEELMSNQRNWNYKGIVLENSISNSKQTIKIFERAIANAQEKNEASYVKIAEWEKQFNALNEDFISLNGISFEEAQQYVDSSNNPNDEYNLQEFDRLNALQDKINGEKFFIHQREKQIEKNEKIIQDIVDWIEMHQKTIV